jgi:hypothetical protein
VLGVQQPGFPGEIRKDCRTCSTRARSGCSTLAVRKDADGAVSPHVSQMSADEQIEFGAVVSGLLGLGAEGGRRRGREGIEAGATLGAETVAERSGWGVQRRGGLGRRRRGL